MNSKKSEKARCRFRIQIMAVLFEHKPTDGNAIGMIMACADIMAAISLITLPSSSEAKTVCRNYLEASLRSEKKVRKFKI